MPYRFVALDLETTWLSPTTDTIIEVAAVAFDIEKNSEWHYAATNIVEHSQLVYPEREMTEEISMITGITDEMLVGKPVWWDIRERVREFIGDESIIVGHNVLFDIAMLATHGIDLSDHGIIDTFELSEIFSQDIESLNLGYLAWAYGLSAWDKEHRALGDTRLSIGLFVHYLNQFEWLSNRKKQILTLCGQHESKENITLFVWITGYSDTIDMESLFSKSEQAVSSSQIETTVSTWQAPTTHYHITSLSPGRKHEREYLRETLSGKTGTICVFWQEQGVHMSWLLEELGVSYRVHEDASEYISELELESMLQGSSWGRKEWILITKLLIWREDTTTGLLRELKLYGEERNLIEYYRAESTEPNRYKDESPADWNIVNIRKWLYHSMPDGDTVVIKDIPLLEEQMRRARSIHVDMKSLMGLLENYSETTEIQEMLLWMSGLYSEFPERPTGENPHPPGEYGETYFLTQGDIWHHGFEALALITDRLDGAYTEWKSTRVIQSRRDTIRFRKIDTMIEFMIHYHRRESSYGTILTIVEWDITLTYIPRVVDSFIDGFFAKYSHAYLSGVGIHGEKMQDFLTRESSIPVWDITIVGSTGEKSLSVAPNILEKLRDTDTIGGTVILTTSMKHVRELGKSLEKTGKKILMQGISGGKWKQLWLFTANRNNTILIGTIDMWRDTLTLWSMATNIILAKLPFDPPTDSYFLARTVGMKNNFSLYSEPMMIIKLNTLIERIYSSGYEWSIYCLDNRLSETTWGQEILREIV